MIPKNRIVPILSAPQHTGFRQRRINDTGASEVEMTDLIKTERLVLRRPNMDDAVEIARHVGDWEVIKWLTAPPYPYSLTDAERFLNDDMSVETFAITADGQYLGNVGLHGVPDSTALEFGYWLGKPFWGQGFMSEATNAVVADHFDHLGGVLLSGYLQGNVASATVLGKLGFLNTEIVMRHSAPWDKKMSLQRMELTAKVWQARHG